MDEVSIRRALKALGVRPGGGVETALSTHDSADNMRQRLDTVAEQALQAIPAPRAGASAVEQACAALALALLEEGRTALKEVAAHGERASLSAGQRSGLEAIVRLTGRPSLLVVDAEVVEPTPEWRDDILINASTLGRVVAAVGRLRVREFVDEPYLGTAFLVAPGLAMTNLHVAITFAERHGNGWTVGTGLTPLVDFLGEAGRPATSEFRVTAIECLHPDPRLDLAVLRLEGSNAQGDVLPAPVALNSDVQAVKAGERIYVVGYPGADDRHEAAAIEQVFGRELGVKRFAPGEIMAVASDGLQFTHDCSTLRGNSGSGAFSLTTGRLYGLHRAGTAGLENRAVSLAALRQDPRLLELGIGG